MKGVRTGVQVQVPEGDPLVLSFWLASNIPLHFCTRHELLAADSTSYRLRRLTELLQEMRSSLRCRKCQCEVSYLAISNADLPANFLKDIGFSLERHAGQEAQHRLLESLIQGRQRGDVCMERAVSELPLDLSQLKSGSEKVMDWCRLVFRGI